MQIKISVLSEKIYKEYISYNNFTLDDLRGKNVIGGRKGNLIQS